MSSTTISTSPGLSVTTPTGTTDSSTTTTSSSATSSSTPSSTQSTTTTTTTTTSDTSRSSSTSSTTTPSSTSTTSSTRSTSTSSSTSSTSTSTTSSTTTHAGTTTKVISTVTLVVPPSNSATTSTTSSSIPSTHAASGFFSNTGAVAGTFTAVGVVGIVIIIGIIVLMINKRRAKQLDKEIAAAAYEANIQAGRNNAAINEMDWEDHYPPSSGTHGIYSQQPGVGTAHDPYSENAYPMRTKRLSQGSLASAGIAGLGARGGNAGDPSNGAVPTGGRYAADPRGEPYQNPYQSLGNSEVGHHAGTRGGAGGIGRGPTQRSRPSDPGPPYEQPTYDPFATYPSQGAYDPQQQQYAAPLGPQSDAPRPPDEHNQEYDGAYGGLNEYDDDDDEQRGHQRDAEQDRVGSLQEDDYHEGRGVLKVTN